MLEPTHLPPLVQATVIWRWRLFCVWLAVLQLI